MNDLAKKLRNAVCQFHTEFSSIAVDGTCIKPQRYAKCLGFYFDSKLALSKHVTEIVKTCNFTLMNFRKIGIRFSKKLKVQLTQAYQLCSVMSQLLQLVLLWPELQFAVLIAICAKQICEINYKLKVFLYCRG